MHPLFPFYHGLGRSHLTNWRVAIKSGSTYALGQGVLHPRAIYTIVYIDFNRRGGYNLEEQISETHKDYPSILLSLFQKKYKKAEEDPNIFITDFKCGEIDNIPLRWDKESIKTGKQLRLSPVPTEPNRGL